MSSTNFTSGTTIASSWLNDVNNAIYNTSFPNAPGGTTQFLRADGTWAVPSGGGSMTYPSSGIANSTGSAWGTSYTTSGSGTVIPLATGATLVTPTISSTFTWSGKTMSAPTGGATAYLNANGGWTTPSGTGTPNLNAVLTAGNISTGGMTLVADSLTSPTTYLGVGSQINYATGITVYGIASPSTYVGMQNNYGGGSPYSVLLSSSAFIPYPDNAIDLGASPYRWKSLGVNGTFYWSNATITAPNTSSGDATKFLNQQGSWVVPSGTGSGLTSVGLSMPTGFSVASSPLTSNGTLAVTWSGQVPTANLGTGTANTTSFLRGDGTWSSTFTSNATINGVGIGNQVNFQTGTTVYGMTTTSQYIGLQNGFGTGTPYTVLLSGAAFIPYPDNAIGLGGASYRWSSLAIGTGSFAWNGYTIPAPGGSTSTFLRNDGQWVAPASAGVTTFNTRSGTVTLTSSDVTTALGYTPLSTTPSLQSVCAVGSTYSSNATFNGVAIGVSLSGYTGIGTNATSVGISNGNGSNIVLLQNSNLVPISASAIGLGTSSLPWGSLAVSGSAYFGSSSSWSQTITVYATAGSSAVAMGAYVSGSSSNAIASVVASTTSNLAYFGYGSSASPTGVGTISTNGTGVTYGTASDRRLKSNIVDYTSSGSFIDSLKPRSYTWNTTEITGVGFVADELQVVCPDAVSGQPDAVDENDKPMYQSIDASTPEMIANIVAELQSLRARLKAANL